MLIYHPSTDRYLGQWLAVPRPLFDRAMAALIAGGVQAGQARTRLLDERAWEGIEGVEPAQLCGHCRAAISRPRQFCDVLCEAAFVATR